jgi:very-short-patch-repair endonuclease
MSKLATKVRGTTHYKIDFGRLKPGDKLQLVRDPQNNYDCNAIKVLHNDMMLGHVDKQIAAVLAGIIDSGAKVRAELSKILGGPPCNYGLLINISIVENRDQSYYYRSGDGNYVGDINLFEVRESTHKHDISYNTVGYDKMLYYKHKYKLEDEVSIGAKPDFKVIYKSTHGVLTRIFSAGIDKYISDETRKWDEKVEQVNKHNLNIKSKMHEYDRLFDNNDFEQFKKRYFINIIVNKLNIAVKDKAAVERDILDGYVTTYELLLYEKLLGKVWMFRQVIIKGHSLDFLLFNLDSNKIWALEVDGGIHRMLHKFNKDNECAEELNKIGISIIRVSNSLISSNIDNVVERILATVNKM